MKKSGDDNNSASGNICEHGVLATVTHAGMQYIIQVSPSDSGSRMGIEVTSAADESAPLSQRSAVPRIYFYLLRGVANVSFRHCTSPATQISAFLPENMA